MSHPKHHIKMYLTPATSAFKVFDFWVFVGVKVRRVYVERITSLVLWCEVCLFFLFLFVTSSQTVKVCSAAFVSVHESCEVLLS